MDLLVLIVLFVYVSYFLVSGLRLPAAFLISNYNHFVLAADESAPFSLYLYRINWLVQS